MVCRSGWCYASRPVPACLDLVESGAQDWKADDRKFLSNSGDKLLIDAIVSWPGGCLYIRGIVECFVPREKSHRLGWPKDVSRTPGKRS